LKEEAVTSQLSREEWMVSWESEDWRSAEGLKGLSLGLSWVESHRQLKQ
jgi:hypothetical protein